jgi:hypothetical protein
MTYSTTAANSAADGGGLNNSGDAMLSSSIVAGSQEGGNCAGPVTDGGYNIDSGDTCGFDPANNSMPNTDPMLGELSDNGGPTPTHALLLGSPAMDAADPGSCPATDQRGVPRPADGDGDGEAICDIGSFEFRPATTISKSADPDVASAGLPLTYTLQITNLAYCTSTTTITDFLPAHVTPTGTLVWTPVEIAPGGTWTENVVVTVEVGYQGVLTNVLQATSLEGYRGIFTLTTPVYPSVQADFVANPTTGLSPLTVILTNTSTGEYDTSLWLFGDGATSTLTSPTHTYMDVRSYTVTLTVHGPGGTDTEIKERYITVQYGVYLPVILRGG